MEESAVDRSAKEFVEHVFEESSSLSELQFRIDGVEGMIGHFEVFDESNQSWNNTYSKKLKMAAARKNWIVEIWSSKLIHGAEQCYMKKCLLQKK